MNPWKLGTLLPLGCLLQVAHIHALVSQERIHHFASIRNELSGLRPLHYSILGGRNDDHEPLSSSVDFPEYHLLPTEEDCIELKEGQRLVCIGDIHGDSKALQSSLKIAGLCESNTWVGGNTILVQCGDVLDRGSEELACYSLLAKLSQEAEKEGGRVICLYGNHEALNAFGQFSYATSDEEYEQEVAPAVDGAMDTKEWRKQYVGNQPARWAAFEPNGLLSRPLLANMKVAVKVGRTVCVHAGLTKDHLDDFGGIESMNRKARQWITGSSGVVFNNHGEYDSVLQAWVEAEARQAAYIDTAPKFLDGGIGSTSPIWMRAYSSPGDQPPANPKAQSMIDSVLKALDCDRMVMGHTVQREINCALQGKAWRVDVGMSRGVVGGTPEVLEITMQDGQEVISVLNAADGRIEGSERNILALSNLF
ncbi:unnamed protein product [Cylindrotheca closterium]|uniref:Calcineurin-like phosphoesterase domain-containing protein n=1 Tax=Cylindrotheca closterium TaxID=2856 RepID=A0AAD2FX36_9STRA|nr:unnamed protein product [Cylindrotheca closterium]